MEEKRIPKKVLYMNLETTRLRGRPRNRWQEKVRKDGRLADGIEWRERVHNREKWKKLLRTARNHRILHMPMNESYAYESPTLVANFCDERLDILQNLPARALNKLGACWWDKCYFVHTYSYIRLLNLCLSAVF